MGSSCPLSTLLQGEELSWVLASTGLLTSFLFFCVEGIQGRVTIEKDIYFAHFQNMDFLPQLL